jgi:hypothetical protein
MMEGGTQIVVEGGLQVKRTAAVLVLVLSSGVFAARAADSSKINGWISDSMCGAKHAGSGSACVKKCLEGGMGMSPVFVDEDKKAVWTIDNPDSVKAFYGDHVTITGTADSDKKSVHIDSIAEVK